MFQKPMSAGEKTLEDVFSNHQRNIIPLFQRPYVWNAEDNWSPLWEDIMAASTETEASASDEVLSAVHRTYFLGAIVLQDRAHHANNLHHVNVIDGQQRLTTMQVIFCAARRVALKHGYEFQADRFESLVLNLEKKVHHSFPEDKYKLWPLPLDRDAFLWVVEGNPESRPDHRLADAFDWFASRIEQWIDESENPEARLGYLYETLCNRMMIVQIELGTGDDPQVVFEVLNHRGTQLDGADLIKNLLFQQLEKAGDSTEAEHLLANYWLPLDGQTWRREVTTGRVKRTRADVLLGYWLAAQTREDVSAERLYDDFRASLEKLNRTPSELIKSIRAYADTMDALEHSSLSAPEGGPVDRMIATNTNTPWPLLLWTFSTDDIPYDQKLIVLRALDSYLMRRGICRLTSQNYNRLFLSALAHLSIQDLSQTGHNLVDFLSRQEADSTKWPDDEEFRAALNADNFFWSVLRARTRSLLLGIDNWLNDGKTLIPLSSANDKQLNVEHIMPQQWDKTWPIEIDLSDEQKEIRTLERNLAVQRLGNLTVVRGKLNSALSNAPWSNKRKTLLKYSPLAITSFSITGDLSGGVQSPESLQWDEKRISERGEWLTDLALKIWPRGE